MKKFSYWLLFSVLCAGFVIGSSTLADTGEVSAQQLTFTPITVTTTASNVPLEPPPPPLSTSPTLPLTPLTAESSTLINLDTFRADPRFAGIDGTGYAVAILDTGIDLDHPFFGPDGDGDGIADRIVYQEDFADGDLDATDVNGHGSNVSSIAAGFDVTYSGMATGADIIHLKVFENSGLGTFGYLEQALQWVVANAAAYNIVSVNMSLGDSGNYATSQTLYGIDDELQALADAGVVVVSASGNSFFGFGSTQGVAYPSADPNSLSIGAVYDSDAGGFAYTSGAEANTTDADRITPFSQRHETLTTVFAPGAPILGAGTTGGTTEYHGTSQAAPHIAGIVALLQQLADQELGRTLAPTEVVDLILASSVTINDGDDEDDNVTNTGLNFPRIDVFALAELLLVSDFCQSRLVTIAGTPGNDLLLGTNGADVIHGFAGNDEIHARGGDDIVCAGTGADDVFGGNGADSIRGGGGNDEIFGQNGADTLLGLWGNDQMYGGAGDDDLDGGDGNDELYGGQGNDSLNGEDGDDDLYGGYDTDTLNGGPDVDFCDGGPDLDGFVIGSCETAVN